MGVLYRFEMEWRQGCPWDCLGRDLYCYALNAEQQEEALRIASLIRDFARKLAA
jgi:hypothetical protein